MFYSEGDNGDSRGWQGCRVVRKQTIVRLWSQTNCILIESDCGSEKISGFLISKSLSNFIFLPFGGDEALLRTIDI